MDSRTKHAAFVFDDAKIHLFLKILLSQLVFCIIMKTEKFFCLSNGPIHAEAEKRRTDS